MSDCWLIVAMSRDPVSVKSPVMTVSMTAFQERVRCFGLGVRLQGLLLLDALMPVALYGCMFVLYCIQGRFANYFPTISETGTGYPNTIYSGVIFFQLGAISFFNRLYIILLCFSCYRPHFSLIVGLIAFSIGSFAGNAGLASLPVNVDPPSHFIAASCCFGCTIAFQFVLVLVEMGRSGWVIQIYRIGLVLSEIIVLEACAHSDGIVDIRAEDTVSTLGEWLYVAGLLLFWPTFLRQWATFEIVGIVEF
jgi:hypothetical protein